MHQTSQYLPDVLQLPQVGIPWKEMQWLKQDDKAKKQDGTVIVTSTRNFLAGDQRIDYESELRKAQKYLQELESSLQDPSLSPEDRILVQQQISVQKEAVTSLKTLVQEFSEKGKDYKDYIEYCAYAKAQLSITVSYTDDIESLWKNQLAKAAENPLVPTLVKADIGDEGRIAVTEAYAFLWFIKGNFFVSVQAITRPELAEKVGKTIASTLGMLLLVAPIQVLHQDIPFISGKKMGVFVAVKVKKETLKYTLSLKVSKGHFLRNEYTIPLNAATPVEFDLLPPVDDGGTWEKEVAEPITGDDVQQCRDYFNVREEDVKFFRFCLKPTNPDHNGHYWFRADILDNNKKVASMSAGKRTVPSPSVTIAVVPVKVGYWAHPKEWIDKAIEREGKIPRDFPDNYLYVWTDLIYTQFMESLTEKEKEKVEPIKHWLKRAFQSGEGERAYTETAKRMAWFTKGVFPFAEERIRFTIFKGDECDIIVDPHESSIDTIAKTLEKWAKDHNYQKVVGIVPGYKKGMGGVNFDLGGVGVYTWWFGKNAVVVALQAPAHVGAHELAHTYGAVDEYLGKHMLEKLGEYVPVKGRGQPILNTALGKDSGEIVTNGFWAAKKKFMGTPTSPKDSIMGKSVDYPAGWLISSIESLAWIGPTLYKGMVTLFHPWLEK